MKKKISKLLSEVFGTSSAQELIKKKSTEQQFRMIGISKPVKVTLTPDECRGLCASVGVEYLPGYESRVLQYAITDESVDRYGDIIRATGIDTTNYQKNPIILYMHSNRELPVGKTLKLWLDTAQKKWMAWGLFMDERVDSSGVSDATFRMASSGFLPGCSIGFLPVKVNSSFAPGEREELGLGDWGVEFLECELLEWSPVSIPANPNAVQEGLAMGVSSRDFKLLRERGLLSEEIGKQVDELPAEETTDEEKIEEKMPPTEPTPTPDCDDEDEEDGEEEQTSLNDLMKRILKQVSADPEVIKTIKAELEKENLKRNLEFERLLSIAGKALEDLSKLVTREEIDEAPTSTPEPKAVQLSGSVTVGRGLYNGLLDQIKSTTEAIAKGSQSSANGSTNH